MARGGINKAIVQKAREALLARGENPSIDAAATHEDAAVRLTGEIAAMKTTVAKG